MCPYAGIIGLDADMSNGKIIGKGFPAGMTQTTLMGYYADGGAGDKKLVYGGIYFDTDVELLKNLDGLLHHEAFYGFENNSHVNTGQGFGSETHHPTVKAMLGEYQQLQPVGSSPMSPLSWAQWD